MQKTPITLKILTTLSWIWFAIVSLVAAIIVIPDYINPQHAYIFRITVICALLVLLQFFAAFSLQRRKSYAPIVVMLAAVVFMTITLMAKIIFAIIGVTINAAIVLLVLMTWKHFLLAKS